MKKHHAQLVDALANQKLVILYRKTIDNNRLTGYVVAFSDRWILIHVVDGSTITLNGYHAVRLNDISRFKFDEDFVDAYLRLRGLHPKLLPMVDVSDLPSLLRSVSQSFSLFMVERERVEPGIGLIGLIEKLTKQGLWLKKINSKAKWIDTESLKLKSITAVSFGDGYTEALTWIDAHDKKAAVDDERPRPTV